MMQKHDRKTNTEKQKKWYWYEIKRGRKRYIGIVDEDGNPPQATGKEMKIEYSTLKFPEAVTKSEVDSQLEIDQRQIEKIAQELQDEKITFDFNPLLVSKVLEIMQTHYGVAARLLQQASQRALQMNKKNVSKVLKLLDGVDRKFYFFNENDTSQKLVTELNEHLERVKQILTELENCIPAVSSKKWQEVKDEHEGQLILAIKLLIENEIKRRKSQKPPLRLSPLPHERSIDYPSYKNQWKLVTKLLNYFYPLELFSSEIAVRQKAERYKRQVRGRRVKRKR